jgi:hypothetical protein
LRSRVTSSIDLWTETAIRNPSAGHLVQIANYEFGQKISTASSPEADR